MPSGISAQGSKVEVGTGSGAAKNISAISAGFPAIVTSAAHGLNNGDVVDLASIVGTVAAGLNGTKRVISNKTANTFALLDFDATGLAYTSGGTATPVEYTKVGGLKTFDGFDGAADELDTTDLDSTAKEFIPGLRDEGKFGFEAKVLKADAGQQALRAARAGGTIVPIKLTLPDTSVASFNVFVKTMPASGGVNAVLMGKIETRITGPVVWS